MTKPKLSKAGWLLLVATGYLLIIGVLVQFSIQSKTQTATSKPLVHLLAAGIGLGFLGIAAWLPWHRLRTFTVVAYALTLVLLVLVGRYGPVVFGARRWLLIGNFQLQPSELLKPLLAFVDALLLVGMRKKARGQQLLLLVGALLLPVFLLLRQPDLSTSLILILIWVTQLLASPLRGAVVGWLLTAMAFMGVLALPLLSAYQHGRIQNFVKSRGDASASSYNVVQARVAIGSGGLTGQGLTGGSQTQLRFLPAQQTDFVFAVVAEKLGFIGAMSVLLAEVTVGLAAWRIANRAKSTYLLLVGVGVAAVFSAQAFINVAMNVGLAPVSGLPLPFVSYGGTSLVVCLAMVGWLLGIDRQAFTYPSTSVNLDQS